MSKMRRTKIFLVVLGLIISYTTAHATDYGVKVMVVDSLGESEMFATVRLFNDLDTIKPIYVGVTDENGLFDYKINEAGRYQLKIQSTGKNELVNPFSVDDATPIADLGTLVMQDNAEVLGEVTVMAQRPLVTKDIDRIGYDVQADESSKTSSIIEMLRKVPMVNVDAQNNITVKGSTSFKVYKNGRPNNSFTIHKCPQYKK